MSSTTSPDDGGSTRVLELDSCGDAWLVFPGEVTTKFRVSTRVLSLASKYFNTLFNSAFAEAVLLRQGNCPEIVLKEDDADVMEIILSVLHYCNQDANRRLGPEEIRDVALHSKKYMCNQALSPWVHLWFPIIEKSSWGSDEFAAAVTAAHLFEDPVLIELWSKRAACYLSSSALKRVEAALPDTVKDSRHNLKSLTIERKRILKEIHQIVKTMGRRLEDSTDIYIMATSKRCPRCGTIENRVGFEQCDKCYSEDDVTVSLLSHICDRQWRISAFVDAMSSCGLSSFHTWSRCEPIILIARKLRQAAKVWPVHACDTPGSCILELCLEGATKAVEKLLRDELGHSTDLSDDEDAAEDLKGWEHSEGSVS